MPLPSGAQSDFNSGFGSLLAQLAEEHDREIAALQRELKDLRQVDGGVNALTGRGRLPLEGEAKKNGPLVSPPAGPPVKIEAVEQSELHEPQGQEDAPLERKATATTFKEQLSEVKDFNLSLDVTALPEEEDAKEIAFRIAKWKICLCLGLKQEDIHRWILKWLQYAEPKRKRTRLYNLVENKWFQTLCLIVIFLNTLHILWATDEDIRSVSRDPKNFKEADVIDFRFWLDLVFCSFYTFELSLKVFVHGVFFFVGNDWGWNNFDAILVFFSLFDVIVTAVLAEEATGRPNVAFLRALRILRMARVMRMVRAVKWIQELRLMLDCVLNSAFHLFWCIILIMLVLVIFALLLVQGVTTHLTSFADDLDQFQIETELFREKFDSVPSAMLSLFESTTGGDDWTDFYTVISRAGPGYDLVFLFYIAFFAIVAWNIVMSTFVEKALKLATPDIDVMIMEKRRKDLHYAKELTNILRECMDEDKNEVISLHEFKKHMGDMQVKKFFQARDLDMKDAELFFRMLASVHDPDGQSGEVDIRTFVLGCMRLRGVASNIDVQALHYDLKNMFRHEREEIRRLVEAFEGHVRSFSPAGNGDSTASSLPMSLDRGNMALLRSANIEVAV